jgi:uncharacterized protein YndB with AHSA1/START domain
MEGQVAQAATAEAVQTPRHVFSIYIRTTPERLWEAITSPEFTQRYYHGSMVESDWRPGSPMVYRMPDGSTAIDGAVLEADPPRRLVTTTRFLFDETAAGERPSRVTWEIEPAGPACKLTLVHDDFDGNTAAYRITEGGWVYILSGLKTLLETGEPLVVDD